ncbi:MFS transporter [Streptomyces sp. NPDC048751]|uniref:MFS transporter n=1 Tax=Streptomyces sp. NPDC048751 TaxID=3365591 RepID=UPI00371D0FCD
MKRRYTLGLYLTGAVTARTGDDMSGPALLLAGFALSGSATDASTLLAAITVAAVVGGPVLGALLDRAERPGRLLSVALVLYAAGLTGVLVGLGRLPFGATVLVAVLTGLLGPALSGGWTAQLPRVVSHQRLPRANALDAMTYGSAGLVGPALAGGVAEVAGAPAAVVVSAALVAVAVPAAWVLPGRGALGETGSSGVAGSGEGRGPSGVGGADEGRGPSGVGGADEGRGSSGVGGAGEGRGVYVVGGLVAGARLIVTNRRLARATVSSVVSCAAQGMLMACLPLLGAQVLGGAGRGALLLSCTAVSALSANAVLARRPYDVAPETVIRAGALLQAAASALAATGRPVTVVMAALLAGVGEGPQLAALLAVRHREAPEHLRGQVCTTGASAKITGFALGAAAAGPLGVWSLPGALLSAAALQVVAARAVGRSET